MQNTVTVEDVKARLEDLLGRARRGDEWLIVDPDGHLVGKLSAPPAEQEMGGRNEEDAAQKTGPVQWPDFMARLREQWPNGMTGQPVSEIVDEGRGPRP